MWGGNTWGLYPPGTEQLANIFYAVVAAVMAAAAFSTNWKDLKTWNYWIAGFVAIFMLLTAMPANIVVMAAQYFGVFFALFVFKWAFVKNPIVAVPFAIATILVLAFGIVPVLDGIPVPSDFSTWMRGS